MKNYKLSDEAKTTHWGTVLHRIVATTTFTLACDITINAGDVGGWIEKESNLSDNAWVSDEAEVYNQARVSNNALISGNARVYGNALVYGNARISGDAQVFGDALISGNAQVSDHAKVYGDADVFGDAEIYDDAKVMNISDYLVFKNNWSSGRYFTWTKSNDKWTVGCFYGTGDELIKKAYADSEDSGKHYEAYVKLVETLKNMEQEK